MRRSRNLTTGTSTKRFRDFVYRSFPRQPQLFSWRSIALLHCDFATTLQSLLYYSLLSLTSFIASSLKSHIHCCLADNSLPFPSPTIVFPLIFDGCFLDHATSFQPGYPEQVPKLLFLKYAGFYLGRSRGMLHSLQSVRQGVYSFLRPTSDVYTNPRTRWPLPAVHHIPRFSPNLFAYIDTAATIHRL